MNAPRHNGNDGERVKQAACALDVAEFEIFRRAYNDWFGHEGEGAVLERDFTRYLFFGITPPWVRHFARMCLDQAQVAPRAARGPGALLRLVDARLGGLAAT